MSNVKLDRTFATLEHAADHAHLASFEKTEVTQKTKAAIASALNHCVEASSDLERFLGHAAAATIASDVHRDLYDAAKAVAKMPIVLREALASVDAFRDCGGSAIGAVHRAALEVKVALEGRSDALVLAEVARAFLRALERYDEALDEVCKTRSGFIDLVLEQRKALAHLQRRFAVGN